MKVARMQSQARGRTSSLLAHNNNKARATVVVVPRRQRSTTTTTTTTTALVSGRVSRASRMALSFAVAAAARDLNAVTVADTKSKFLDAYAKPIPALYNTIVQELLVQSHLIKFGAKFEYDKLYALGFLSVYDGVMESFPDGNQDEILGAFLGALEEDKQQMRADAAEVTEWASSLGGVEEVLADASGSAIQQEFVKYASAFSEGSKVYNKFFGVGMFRLLELAKATDPASLEKLSTSLSVPLARVTADLATYKGMLTKMTKAKELMQEIIEEQRKKSAQREAEKAQTNASSGELPNGGTPASA
uniref:Uncharacterized protein n=2 Tax=Chloropicon primus TaxID=1764295 RepID=A0A7S2T3V4_9CHLO